MLSKQIYNADSCSQNICQSAKIRVFTPPRFVSSLRLGSCLHSASVRVFTNRYYRLGSCLHEPVLPTGFVSSRTCIQGKRSSEKITNHGPAQLDF